jgi:CHAT domain-containing protein
MQTRRRFVLGVLLVCVLISAGGCAVALVAEEDRLMPAGRYSELERLMESRVKTVSQAPSNQLWYLCTAYWRVKKYDKLFPCLDQLERNIAAGDTTVNFFDMSAFGPILRAQALIEFGDYPRAVAQAQKAWDVIVKRDLARASRIAGLEVLALAEVLNGDHEGARRHAKELEDIGTYYPFILLATPKMTALAKVYAALGEYDKSLQALELTGTRFAEALTDLVAAGGTMSVHTSATLPRDVMMARALFETGAFDKSKTMYDALLARRETASIGDLYWLALFDRGRIAEQEGQRQAAIDFYTNAVEVIERQRATINTEVNKVGFVADKQDVYRRLIALLLAEGQARSGFEYAERAKARALVDLLAGRSDYAVRGTNAGRVRTTLAQLATAEAEARVQETTESVAETERRQTRSVSVGEQLRADAPELASLVTVTRVSAGDIQALIGPDETLLEYYYQGEDAYAFVLTRRDLVAVKLDGKELRNDIATLRAAFETPGSLGAVDLAQRVYRRLFAGVAERIMTENVLLVPHGILHYVPFTALHDGTRYLIDRASVRVLPSASVLPYLARRPIPTTRRLLAFGNPALGDRRYDLKFAEEEAVSIAKTFTQSQVLLRNEATKDGFVRLSAGVSHIHFAGHGRFDSDAPMTSGLMLAGVQPGAGLLSLGELYDLQLDADLVTLSACETGLGKVQSGDDVVGLTRGFLYAGVRSIVSSLWKVDDRATSTLMIRFYENLKIMNKRDALRAAQRSIRGEFPHPFYWAAFQLTGLAD